MCDQQGAQQGYCGLCRVLYRDLNQHLSSLQHLDAVGLSSRGAESSSSRHSSRTSHSLLERFLHDVLQHHPHSYGSSQPDSTAPPGPHGETTPPHTSAPPPVPQVTWSTWQRNRRQQQRDDFSSEHCSSTIEEVIRRYCYGHEDDGSDSLHFSLPVSMETQTEWEVDVEPDPVRADIPLAAVETLLQLQMDVEQDYTEQLQWVLEPEGRVGFLERPIETVLPAPQLIPPSFRGKSWTQIEKEDEARVMKLVQQFKTGVRTCYFDSESLARFGCRGYGTRKTPDLLPLFDHEEEEEEEERRRRKRPGFRLAARCQVVKLSRATQTLCVSSLTVTAPEAKRLLPEATPTEATPTEATPTGATPSEAPPPEQLVSGAFPEKYSSVLTPLQRQTSVLYLLCPFPSHAPAGAHAPRRRRRPARALRSKVTYRRQPLTPLAVKPFSAKPFSVKPRCVRQLFRNLCPETNTGPAPKATPTPAPRREGLRSRRSPRT